MYPRHLKNFDYIGLHQYFLTFCTQDRRHLFTSLGEVTLARTQIVRACREHSISLFAYCFMPDHAHLLVQGESDDSDCKLFIERAKQYSGFHYRAAFKRRLWERYGYERVLRKDEDAIGVARYILENPVRAGLVAAAQDYPFSGSDVYSLEQLLDAIQLEKGWHRRSR
jgi:putative transposase